MIYLFWLLEFKNCFVNLKSICIAWQKNSLIWLINHQLISVHQKKNRISHCCVQHLWQDFLPRKNEGCSLRSSHQKRLWLTWCCYCSCSPIHLEVCVKKKKVEIRFNAQTKFMRCCDHYWILWLLLASKDGSLWLYKIFP